MSEELEITITPTGAMTIEAKGHRDVGCITELNTILKDIEKDGIEAGSKNTKKKQEYYAAGTKQTIKTSH